MSGQPQDPGNLVFNIVGCEALEEGGIAPSIIINTDNRVQFKVKLELLDQYAELMDGDGYMVGLHSERLEDGDRKFLNGGNYNVPNNVPGSFEVTTPYFTTGAAGSGADFEIPAGFATGTFEITLHVHFEGNNLVGGFHQLVIMVAGPPED